ncbi:hypothetical protein ULMS_25150 [Patiriisocius marinistellae]|uniref:Lipoprotein n=2 Tax=Patiriisocius marinistellae TaxID=2494560 RepID=A0A5J4FWA8_9FLAO|nr:hypothetical protein ULMS_25150 [Patiriisocius marinistellae]
MGCSTSKTIPSQWVSADFKNQKIDRLLVYANTEDTNLQVEFENKVALSLTKQGLSPLKMHVIFPEISYKENRTQEEINQFALECKNKNINKVLLASRKSMIVDTVNTKSLHNYFNTLEPLKLGKTDVNSLVYDKKEIITYTLEAAVYDIGTTSEDKPIATSTLKAINPKSLDKLKEEFLDAIVLLFKNK